MKACGCCSISRLPHFKHLRSESVGTRAFPHGSKQTKTAAGGRLDSVPALHQTQYPLYHKKYGNSQTPGCCRYGDHLSPAFLFESFFRCRKPCLLSTGSGIERILEAGHRLPGRTPAFPVCKRIYPFSETKNPARRSVILRLLDFFTDICFSII